MAGLYREGLWRKEAEPWAGDARMGVRGMAICQSYPITGRDRGMLGEPGSRVHLDVLNRHLGHLSWV